MAKRAVYGQYVFWAVVASWLTSAGLAFEEPQQPKQPGIESPDYIWNSVRGEKLIALKAKGDAARGAVAYEICQGCHGARALGRADGTYPRLAGQHATVLIKQLTDVRAGLRDNQTMYPYVGRHVITPQEIADIAMYLQGLPSPDNNGTGPGTALARGETIYQVHCADCHGTKGRGAAAKFYPRVAGQHYAYLLREARMIRDGRRRNVHPEMVAAIADYDADDLSAVADYMSRLPDITKP